MAASVIGRILEWKGKLDGAGSNIRLEVLLKFVWHRQLQRTQGRKTEQLISTEDVGSRRSKDDKAEHPTRNIIR
jgi:hypothetical protein